MDAKQSKKRGRRAGDKVRGRDMPENQCRVHQGCNVMTSLFFSLPPCGIMESRSVLLQESPWLMEGTMDGRTERWRGDQKKAKNKGERVKARRTRAQKAEERNYVEGVECKRGKMFEGGTDGGRESNKGSGGQEGQLDWGEKWVIRRESRTKSRKRRDITIFVAKDGWKWWMWGSGGGSKVMQIKTKRGTQCHKAALRGETTECGAAEEEEEEEMTDLHTSQSLQLKRSLCRSKQFSTGKNLSGWWGGEGGGTILPSTLIDKTS